MAHVRKQIRDLLETQITGLATTGSNVFQNRTTPIPADQLPAISLSLGDESVQRSTMGATKRQSRVVEAQFHIVTGDGASSADTLDQVIAELETALVAGAWSSALIFDIEPRQISDLYDGDGAKIHGEARLSFAVQYHTNEGAPETAIS